MRAFRPVCLLLACAVAQAGPAPLEVVGVLGNTSGMTHRPVPYAFYTGIAADARGRLYLAGAAEGVPVCDQDGRCLAVLTLPEAEGMAVRSLMARAGDAIFCIAIHPGGGRSALYRIATAGEDPATLEVRRITAGPGHWAISPTLDTAGRIVVGQSEAQKLRYAVTAFDPASGKGTPLFSAEMPKGAMRPWRHLVQADPDGAISIHHHGGNNWVVRRDAAGKHLGEALGGQILDGLRYHFNYQGGLRRMDLTNTKPAPGECGSVAIEIRMAAQLIRIGTRYFFAGRGGALEARWNGTNFVYTRRIGGIHVEDMASIDGDLVGVAFTTSGNNDVQRVLRLPKSKPLGQILDATTPLYGRAARTVVPAYEGMVYVYRKGRKLRACYDGRAGHLRFDVPLPQVKEAGQAAVAGKDMLLADPGSGTIWRRPLIDKQAPLAPWRTGLPGVVGLAAGPDAVYAATPTSVARLSADGQKELWRSPAAYKGIRRLAATPEHVYVCDAAGHVVDQLDATSGTLLARLGTLGEPGHSLERLHSPHAVAADLNGVYIADNGNGRVLVATTTLWRPEIAMLPREDASPIVAARIPVVPPAKGRMSVNVYDANDLTVRQLACAQPSDSAVTWDGRDLYGNWAKPGTYRYHGIIAPTFSLRYVTSISQSGTPPYRTADGTGSWGGVWGYAMDVCTVGSEPGSDILVLWAVEEGEGGLVRMSQDGQVRWKAHLAWWMKASQIAVACDGADVYVAGASALGAPEGQEKYSGSKNRPLLWRLEAASGRTKPFQGTTQQSQRMFGDYLEGQRIVTDLAVRQGKVYLTAPAQDTLFVADAASGRQVAAWAIDDVSGAAFDAQGRLVVGSGSKIVELDPQGSTRRTIADAGGEIWDVDCLRDGRLAATVGTPRHQVVLLSPQGKELRSLGRRGGRPKCGKMQPRSFRSPVGLCTTGSGKLFVAESTAPKRFTRWSLDGSLEREFHGPYYYSGMFGIDEVRPEHVYGDTHGDIIRYVVDYATGKWRVDHYWIDAYKDSGVPAKWWPRIRTHDGRTWWCSGSGGIVELAPDRVRGVAAVYGGWLEKLPDGTYEPVYHRKKTGLKGTWSDLNGDGRKQPDEWQVTDKPAYPIEASGPQQGWGAYFDERFDLVMHDWSDTAAGGLWQIPVAEWKNGTPVYRWDQARHVGLPRYHGLQHGASGARTAFAHADATFAFNGGYNAAGLPGVGHGHDWEFAQLTKYHKATGRLLWHAGERSSGFAPPGHHYCPTGPSGVVDDYLFWTDENSLVHVWDIRHGLYVDTLLEDIARGPDPSPYTVWVELFNTRTFRHPKTGKVYLMAASDAIHVFEVIGTEQKMVRFGGRFELTEAGLQAAKQQLAARSVAQERTLDIPRAAGPVTVDGELAEFANAPAASLVLKQTARGSARLLHDDRFLYLAFDVADDSPWKNAGGDPTALFKTGDTVSIWLGPSNKRRQPDLRDARALFGPDGAKTLAVVYRPRVAKGRKPVHFRSPAGAVSMDRVDVLADAQVAVKVAADGYRLEAAIPRAALGLPDDAERFALDLSINFSDRAGQRNVARIHWGRNGAAIVYDLPTEVRFEPGTWGIGRLRK